MCHECGRMRCPSSCPNAPEPETVCVCAGCGAKLVRGNMAYKLGDTVYCEGCVDDAMFIAE